MIVARKSTPDRQVRTVDFRTVVDRVRPRTVDDVRAVGGIVAATVVCTLAATRIARNAPIGQLPTDVTVVYAAASVASVIVTGVVAVAVGVVADADRTLVGLVAAGVFPVLAALDPVAGVPSVGVLSIAAVLVASPALTGRRAIERAPFAGLVVLAVVLSLGGSTGVLAPGARSLGTTATLLALLATPMAVETSGRTLVAGVGAAALVAAGAMTAPFVAGVVFLAVGAAIDPGVVLVAVGIGGGVAVVAEGMRRRQPTTAAGGLLLLAAGVPATVPRALAVVLGTHLLLTSTVPSGGEPT